MPRQQNQRTSLTFALATLLLASAGCADRAAEEAAEESFAEADAEPPTADVAINANDWQVVEIDGEATVADAKPTLQFPEDGRIAGTSGCNRYFSSFEMDGNKITIGNAGATMMACPEPLMQQERRFFDALATVVSYDFNASGDLLLSDGDGAERMRAVPYVEAPPEPLDKASETVHKYDCGDGGVLDTRYVGPDTLEVKVADQTYILPRERSASGAKFTKDGVSFWMKGDEAMFETESGRVNCTRLEEIGSD